MQRKMQNKKKKQKNNTSKLKTTWKMHKSNKVEVLQKFDKNNMNYISKVFSLRVNLTGIDSEEIC